MNVYEMEGFLRGKCLPGDMKVNESNAQYLVRKFSEFESNLSESKREFRAADATIHNLELKLTDMAVQLANAESKCRKLAADNEKAMDSLKQADAAVKLAHEKFSALSAENAGLNNFIAASCFVYAGEHGYWPAIDHSPEIPATNQLSMEESQFLTDVLTAAGLLSCGKRDKQLAQRLSDFSVSKRGGSNPAQIRKGGAA